MDEKSILSLISELVRKIPLIDNINQIALESGSTLDSIIFLREKKRVNFNSKELKKNLFAVDKELQEKCFSFFKEILMDNSPIFYVYDSHIRETQENQYYQQT